MNNGKRSLIKMVLKTIYHPASVQQTWSKKRKVQQWISKDACTYGRVYMCCSYEVWCPRRGTKIQQSQILLLVEPYLQLKKDNANLSWDHHQAHIRCCSNSYYGSYYVIVQRWVNILWTMNKESVQTLDPERDGCKSIVCILF